MTFTVKTLYCPEVQTDVIKVLLLSGNRSCRPNIPNPKIFSLSQGK